MVIKKNPPVNKCTECKGYLKALERARRDDIQQIRLNRSIHWADVRFERRIYRANKELALRKPHQFASLIIDGMDQAKTNLPGSDGSREGMSEAAESVSVRIVGVMMHGLFNDMYLCPEDIPHDSNTTMTILMACIAKLKRLRGGTLPK